MQGLKQNLQGSRNRLSKWIFMVFLILVLISYRLWTNVHLFQILMKGTRKLLKCHLWVKKLQCLNTSLAAIFYLQMLNLCLKYFQIQLKRYFQQLQKEKAELEWKIHSYEWSLNREAKVSSLTVILTGKWQLFYLHAGYSKGWRRERRDFDWHKRGSLASHKSHHSSRNLISRA